MLDFTGVELSSMERAMLDTYLRELETKVHSPERLKALYGSHFYEATIRDKLNSICATAAQMLDAPFASVNMIEADAQVRIATFGGRGPERVEFDRSYCQHVVGLERDLSVDDALTHALVCDLLSTTTEGGIRSYLGVPLITSNGHVLGALCVWDVTQRQWNEAHVSMLTSLAVVIMRFEGEM